MARPKGTKNKNNRYLMPSSLLHHKERIAFLANIIIDGYVRDGAIGRLILKLSGVE